MGQRSTLSAKEALSLVAVSENRVGVCLWRQLFDKVRTRLRRGCAYQKVSLFKEIPIRLPGSCRQLCGPFVDMTKSVISRSPAPRCLMQYYMNRVNIKPRSTVTIGSLLYLLRYTYTPATLQHAMNVSCPCAQYPSICRPAQLNHVVVRATDPGVIHLFPHMHHRRTLAQCMQNATLPTPDVVFQCVHDTTSMFSRDLPQLGSQLWLAMKHAFWEQGKTMYRTLEAQTDVRIHPHAVHNVRGTHQWLSSGPLDKNVDVPIAHGGVLRTQLFKQHIKDSPRYTCVQTYDDPALAESLVLCHIVESAYAQGWAVSVPQNWGKRCAPYCMFYLKHKSCEAIGHIKVRPIISHAGHPLQRLGTRMSRALSVLVDRLASMPENSEAFSMPDVLQHFRHVHDSMLNLHGDTNLWESRELDLEDMLLNIDKGLLLESFDYMIERLDQFAPLGMDATPAGVSQLVLCLSPQLTSSLTAYTEHPLWIHTIISPLLRYAILLILSSGLTTCSAQGDMLCRNTGVYLLGANYPANSPLYF